MAEKKAPIPSQTNVELKFAVSADLHVKVRKLLMTAGTKLLGVAPVPLPLGGVIPRELEQTDTFFSGSMYSEKSGTYFKMRLENAAEHTVEIAGKVMKLPREQLSRLILYTRPSECGVMTSTWSQIVFADRKEAISLTNMLSASNGILVVVHKSRWVWLVDNIRVHLDVVDKLGTCIEFEYCVDDKHPHTDGAARLAELSKELGLGNCEPLECAYADVILAM